MYYGTIFRKSKTESVNIFVQLFFNNKVFCHVLMIQPKREDGDNILSCFQETNVLTYMKI